MLGVRAVAEVQAGDVHSRADEVSDPLRGGGGRSERAHDLGSSAHAPIVVRSAPIQAPGTLPPRADGSVGRPGYGLRVSTPPEPTARPDEDGTPAAAEPTREPAARPLIDPEPYRVPDGLDVAAGLAWRVLFVLSLIHI